MKKFIKRLFCILLLLVCTGAALIVFYQNKITTVYHLSENKEVMIPKGAGLNRTAQILVQNGIINEAFYFILLARLNQHENNLKAGEYVFGGDVSLLSVMDKLVKGEVIVRSLTIPEGKALAEIKKIVDENPYLEGEITIALQEGEILPETYHFNRGEKKDDVLNKARQAMKKTLEEAFLSKEDGLPLKNAQELLVLASIVEKETGVADERGKVASVFVNRLNLGMKLQTDPTVIYAVTNGQMDLGRPIYKKDLAYDSPYNTYVYAGLPPAPICSPGKAAIMAAAHPEKTGYLYFVADGVTGGHRFAKSLSEHNANVSHYRKTKKVQ